MKKSIFTILILLVFCQCGTRKSTKNRTEETAKIEVSTTDKTKATAEANVKQQVVKTTDNKDETVTETVIYTPIDITKPATVTDEEGKTHLLTNSTYKKERTVKKNNTSIKENSNKETTEKAEIIKDLETLTENYKKSDAEKVNIERQAWSLWNLLWLLIPVSLIAVFLKYKGKIWWI
jgi:Flp pilus assembly protein TadB